MQANLIAWSKEHTLDGIVSTGRSCKLVISQVSTILLEEWTDVKTALYLILICFPAGSYLTVSYETSVNHQYIIYESRMHLSYI